MDLSSVHPGRGERPEELVNGFLRRDFTAAHAMILRLHERMAEEHPCRDSPVSPAKSACQTSGNNGNARRSFFPGPYVTRCKNRKDDGGEHYREADPLPKLQAPIGRPAPEKSQPTPTLKTSPTGLIRLPSMKTPLQPVTKSMPHEEWAVEVDGIYTDLVMVEAKCVDVNAKQSIRAPERDPAQQTKFCNEQWQALMALERSLLQKHHGFFLASQHPPATPGLTQSTAKSWMPARLWRHGIHPFLESLRRGISDPSDYIIKSIYIAYSTVALLYINVTALKCTWIACLSDLVRHHKAIGNGEPTIVFASRGHRVSKPSSSLSNRAVRVLVLALSFRHASASSSVNDLSPGPKVSREWPFGPSVPSFSSWPFAVFGMLLAGLSHLLARRLGPSRVSGTMMAVFGFVWLRINGDETTPPVVLWTTFILGVFFMLYYAELQVRKHKMTEGYAVITLLLGIILDYGAAQLSSSQDAGASLDDMMRFSLLAFSVSLFISTYAASQAHRHHSAQPGEAIQMEEGLSRRLATASLPLRSVDASSSDENR